MKRLGIDVGSLFLSAAVLGDEGVLFTHREELRGDVGGAFRRAIELGAAHAPDTLGVTGSLQRSPRWLDNALCVIEGAHFLLPACRNVLVVGGQTALLVFYDEQGRYTEHTWNPPCAAGTGSFLEQQAERIGLHAAELSARAMAYADKPPRIATRCAVFAKSDIIHCMQEGHSVEAVCAGLCEGMGRSIVDALVRGRTLRAPVGMVGGVAENAKVVQAVQEALGVPVIVPSLPWAAGAIGAALLGQERQIDPSLGEALGRTRREQRPALAFAQTSYPEMPRPRMLGDIEVLLADEPERAGAGGFTLGIDIGSTSTKAALLAEDGTLRGGFYTATKGEPVRAVQAILHALGETVPDWRARLRQAGTTGSGRKLIKELFQADLEIDEITAHARAATHLYPAADTIIEIGGQDSKFTRLRQGTVVHSAMNYVCAAGTGSFIEEQAKRLGVPLDELSELALGQIAPYTSDRCTVYMERDLNLLLGEGWSREAVLAAVLFSVRDNYLSKVVNRHPLGTHVVFQGATARNKALVAAFEQYLERPIHVSPHCHLTGAIGVALIAGSSAATRSSLASGDIESAMVREPCTLCSNECVLTVVRKDGRAAGWGMKCGRELEDKKRKRAARRPAVETRYMAAAAPAKPSAEPRGTIGLVDALYHRDYNPLWRDLLVRLGFSVVLSRGGKPPLERGKSLAQSDFCAPMLLAHGAVRELADRGVDAIFVPSLVNDVEACCAEPTPFRSKKTDSYFCYYSQYAPTILGHVPALSLDGRLVAPLLALRSDSPEQIAARIHAALEPRFPGLEPGEVLHHFRAAWSSTLERRAALRSRRPEPVDGALQVVLCGRPYVVFERALHLGIPEQLEQLGVTLLWQDELAGDATAADARHPLRELMHWSYGQRILDAAERVACTPNLFLIYLSCFRCSPDAFLVSYVRQIMEQHDKPFLVLQLDEHSSDVGYTTRIEAALRTFESHRRARPTQQPALQAGTAGGDGRPCAGDTVLIPYINRLMSTLWVECFRREGYHAEKLQNSEKIIHTGYRYANGGECMPAVAIAGGIIEHFAQHELDPSASFLYLPTVCMACNFPQFPPMIGMAVEAAGIHGLKIPPMSLLSPSETFPGLLGARLFESSIVASLVYKLHHRTKPYERRPGASAEALLAAEALLVHSLQEREGLRHAFARVVELFRAVELVDRGWRKPRIAILGDMYVKYNEVVNQGVAELIESLGGAIVIPSMTDMTCHFLDVDIRSGLERPTALRLLQSFERRYERMAADLLGEDAEPDWAECAALMADHGIPPEIAGETSVNVGRALHLLAHRRVDAIVHLNPMFCCPGVVSSALFRQLQAEFSVPIVDIFYDGTGEPNRVLVPQLAYLVERARGGR